MYLAVTTEVINLCLNAIHAHDVSERLLI